MNGLEIQKCNEQGIQKEVALENSGFAARSENFK
jgi:hypothetical protein